MPLVFKVPLLFKGSAATAPARRGGRTRLKSPSSSQLSASTRSALTDIEQWRRRRGSGAAATAAAGTPKPRPGQRGSRKPQVKKQPAHPAASAAAAAAARSPSVARQGHIARMMALYTNKLPEVPAFTKPAAGSVELTLCPHCTTPDTKYCSGTGRLHEEDTPAVRTPVGLPTADSGTGAGLHAEFASSIPFASNHLNPSVISQLVEARQRVDQHATRETPDFTRQPVSSYRTADDDLPRREQAAAGASSRRIDPQTSRSPGGAPLPERPPYAPHQEQAQAFRSADAFSRGIDPQTSRPAGGAPPPERPPYAPHQEQAQAFRSADAFGLQRAGQNRDGAAAFMQVTPGYRPPSPSEAAGRFEDSSWLRAADGSRKAGGQQSVGGDAFSFRAPCARQDAAQPPPELRAAEAARHRLEEHAAAPNRDTPAASPPQPSFAQPVYSRMETPPAHHLQQHQQQQQQRFNPAAGAAELSSGVRSGLAIKTPVDPGAPSPLHQRVGDRSRPKQLSAAAIAQQQQQQQPPFLLSPTTSPQQRAAAARLSPSQGPRAFPAQRPHVDYDEALLRLSQTLNSQRPVYSPPHESSMPPEADVAELLQWTNQLP
ncbi:hypothetical protein DIPPA_07648 [Diplonema papillatum]|nr:hypothetical protein DIPPA_07648 [Diplonema papillatum]